MDSSSEPNAASGVHLIEAVRRGDAAAFDTIARSEAPRLFRVAIRLSNGRREDAEDLVQETLVRALPKLKGLDGRATISTYLFRAMGNLWKNRLRSRGRSPLVPWPSSNDPDAGPSFDPASHDPSPLRVVEGVGRAALIRDAVARLEPTRRLTLLLREIEEMSYEEIAEATGVAVGTVRSRLSRARDDLRSMLEEAS